VRHDLRLDGPAFRLRPVELSDAPAVVALRRDASRSAYINETDPSLEAQERWLERYFNRPGDYYWAVERRSDATVEGFLGIYDVDGEQAEWGRWVLRPGSLAAAESAWLVHEAGFSLLDLSTLITHTLVDNRAVVALHARYGVETLRTVAAYARIGGQDLDAVEGRMTREAWDTSGPLLRGMAERAAALLTRAGTRRG
jgi:RimJ/RimL family protein N-acetyltransferase